MDVRTARLSFCLLYRRMNFYNFPIFLRQVYDGYTFYTLALVC